MSILCRLQTVATKSLVALGERFPYSLPASAVQIVLSHLCQQPPYNPHHQ